MNIATHCNSPEEIMALLDGELSVADAQTLSRHISECDECAKLAEQFRDLSDSLSHWEVPAASAKLDEVVLNAAAQSHPGKRLRQPGLLLRASLWTPRQWTFRGVGALAATLGVIAILLPLKHHGEEQQMQAMAELREQSAPQMQRDVRPHPNMQPIDSLGSATAPRAGVAGIEQRSTDMIAALAPPAASADPSAQISESKVNTASSAPAAPMIARSVSLTMVVKDFSAARARLDAILAKYQGYSAQLTVNTTENAPRSLQASLRIPATDLGMAIGDLRALGRVENEAQSGEEVTQQHADLLARLKTARDTEDRLRAILQQRTGKIQDVLQVEEEIARVRGEIESMEAEQKGLEHRVDFASIDLQLSDEFKAQISSPSPSISTRMHNALVEGYRNAAGLLLGIALFFAEFGPVLLILAAFLSVPVFLLWRRYRKMLARV